MANYFLTLFQSDGSTPKRIKTQLHASSTSLGGLARAFNSVISPRLIQLSASLAAVKAGRAAYKSASASFDY